MDENTIKQIETLIAANKAEKNRTPFLEVALGGLQTTLENSKDHEIAWEKIQAARAEELKAKTDELQKLKSELDAEAQKVNAALAETEAKSQPATQQT